MAEVVNGLAAAGVYEDGRMLEIRLVGASVEEALAMDTSLIEERTASGDLVGAWAGYAKRSATVDVATGRVTLACYLDIDGAGAACDALAKRNAVLEAANADLQAQLDELAGAFDELVAMTLGEEA